jgi:hypothetical protein
MVERVTMSGRNVIEFARYQQDRAAGKAIAARLCRHCGAGLLDGENEDECSSVFNIEATGVRGVTRKFYAD